MTDLTPGEIAAFYGARIPTLKQSRQRHWRGPCPVHNGKDENFAVDSETGLAHCHSRCKQGWDVYSLEMALTGVDFPKAKASVYGIIGRPEPDYADRDIQATFDYCDADGALRYQVVRKWGKKFMQRRPNGHGGWYWGLANAEPLPYRLPRWANADTVAVAEGEKDVHTLESLGFHATCNNGGAGNFKPELARWFTGKKVLIFPDNDEPGRKHALQVAGLLATTAALVKIVELPGLPNKGDVTDFITAGGTADGINAAIAKAQEWSPEWDFSQDVPSEEDKHVRTFSQVVADAGGFQEFWDLAKFEGIPTPYWKLTRALSGGMRKGEVYVIGGNQGSGKTSLGLQFITKALQKKLGVLLFSMEMGWRDVFQRLVAIEARVDLLEYREAQVEAKRRRLKDTPELAAFRSSLLRTSSEFMNLPLTVSTRPRITTDYLVSESQRLKKRGPIDLIVIDHMQLMSTTGSVRGDYEKFTAISRATKETAQTINTPVLLISQTSRNQAHEKRSELEVSDLRGSGAIEEDAAAVMLLYSDHEDKLSALETGRFAKGPVKTWLKLDKNRFGMGGVYLELQHFKGYTRFDEVAPENAQAAGASA